MVNLHVSELRSPDVDLDGEHMFTDSSKHDSRRREGRTQRQGTMRVICMTLMIDSTLEAIIVYGAFVRYSMPDSNPPGCEDDKEYAITNAGTDMYDRQMRNPENTPH